MRKVKLSERWANSSDYVLRDDFETEGRFWDRGLVSASKEVEGHYVIYFRGQDMVNPDIRHGVEILGIVHDSDQVADRLYKYALRYGRGLAQSRRAEFVDETQRHRARRRKLLLKQTT